MLRLLVVAALLALAGCAAAPAPQTPKTSEEAGFTAFCKTHPGKGLCP